MNNSPIPFIHYNEQNGNDQDYFAYLQEIGTQLLNDLNNLRNNINYLDNGNVEQQYVGAMRMILNHSNLVNAFQAILAQIRLELTNINTGEYIEYSNQLSNIFMQILAQLPHW